jgi:hypothetical protein
MYLLIKECHILFPGIPGRFPRERDFSKRLEIPRKREQEIPGSKAYHQHGQSKRNILGELHIYVYS